MLENQLLTTPGDTQWFRHDRFGMFIHWGLYSLAARHEWVKSKEQISDAEYDRRYFKHFDPDLYDPNRWAQAAADAGMKYFVVGTKHHEGFCMWDSKLTDYKVTNTPYGKDVLGPLVKAFNSRGLRTGLYYSLFDWHHPDYVVDYVNHPRRGEMPMIQSDDEDFKHAHGDAKPTRGAALRLDHNVGRDQSRYAKYLRDQVRELLTQFGPVDVLWFDFSFINPDQPRNDFRFSKGREAWESEKLYAMVRELMPNVVLTDRLDLNMPLSGGDMKTPEQAQPEHWVHIDHDGRRVPVTWEACQTFSGSWGYHRDEHDWRSPRQLIETLIDCVSKGGNLLLNVGPTGRGEIDARALSRLDEIGKWMRHHSRSIYGCTQAPSQFTVPSKTYLTYNPQKKRLYLHLLSWPYKFLDLPGAAYADRVEYAQLLHDASEVKQEIGGWHAQRLGDDQRRLTLVLPQRQPEDIEIPVIEMFLKD